MSILFTKLKCPIFAFFLRMTFFAKTIEYPILTFSSKSKFNSILKKNFLIFHGNKNRISCINIDKVLSVLFK